VLDGRRDLPDHTEERQHPDYQRRRGPEDRQCLPGPLAGARLGAGSSHAAGRSGVGANVLDLFHPTAHHARGHGPLRKPIVAAAVSGFISRYRYTDLALTTCWPRYTMLQRWTVIARRLP